MITEGDQLCTGDRAGQLLKLLDRTIGGENRRTLLPLFQALSHLIF